MVEFKSSKLLKLLTFVCLLFVFMLVLLSYQLLHATADSTETATTVANSEGTKPAAILPQNGRWEGDKPSVSFDVTTDRTIHNLKIVGSNSTNQSCTIELTDDISIGADNTFTFDAMVSKDKLDKDLLAEATTLGIATPVAIQTSKGEMVNLVQLRGSFDSATTLSGDFETWLCGGHMVLPSIKGDWSAEWKSESQATPESTSAATKAVSTPSVQAPTASASEIAIVQVVSPGDLQSEAIELRNVSGTVIDLMYWEISDGHDHMYKFSNARKIFPNGKVILYTRSGTDTPFAVFWNQSEAQWGSSDTIMVIDPTGKIQANYSLTK